VIISGGPSSGLGPAWRVARPGARAPAQRRPARRADGTIRVGQLGASGLSPSRRSERGIGRRERPWDTLGWQSHGPLLFHRGLLSKSRFPLCPCSSISFSSGCLGVIGHQRRLLPLLGLHQGQDHPAARERPHPRPRPPDGPNHPLSPRRSRLGCSKVSPLPFSGFFRKPSVEPLSIPNPSSKVSVAPSSPACSSSATLNRSRHRHLGTRACSSCSACSLPPEHAPNVRGKTIATHMSHCMVQASRPNGRMRIVTATYIRSGHC
jgi:hypothetical protein